MLLTQKTKVGTSSRAIWYMILVVAISVSVEAVLLLGLVNMVAVGELVLPALAAAVLAGGLVGTMVEFATLAKEH
jgi:hypothetical protein